MNTDKVNNWQYKAFKIAEPMLIRILEILTIGIQAITKWIQANPKTAQYVILALGALATLAVIHLFIIMVTDLMMIP